MQDEEMDIKIKEAANQHHPPYSDKAWEKMEKMLDKHLPQKKDRRRWFVFLLLFVLLDAAILVAIVKPWKSSGAKKTEIAKNDEQPSTVKQSVPYSNQAENVQTTPGTVADQNTAGADPSKTNASDLNNNDRVNGQTSSSAVASNTTGSDPAKNNASTLNNNKPASKQTSSSTVASNKIPTGQLNKNAVGSKTSNRSSNKKDITESIFRSGKRPVSQKSKTRTTVLQPGLAEDNNKKVADVPADQPFSNIKDLAKKAVTNEEKKITDDKALATTTDTDPDKKPDIKTELAKKTDDKKDEKKPDKKNGDNKIKNEKPKKGFANNFAITATIGGDMSYISLKKPGKITMVYGAGLSYGFAKHFSVSAGFYVSDKIYSATPEQYNTTTYPYLTNINADCKIYQVPVSIGYHFGQKKKHSWSGSAGLTTLLMKKEVYDYQYKTPAGQNYSYQHTVDNQNKHYFSVLSLAAGYRYHLGNRVTLAGEPFVNIPLTGIGFGKVKLNSAGVQVTVSVKPFAKKK